MHFAGRRHVAGHTFFSDLLTIALLVHGAAANPRKHQLVVGFIVQVDSRFEAVKRLGDLVYDLVYQFIQIEN